jgi:hypothetical protein
MCRCTDQKAVLPLFGSPYHMRLSNVGMSDPALRVASYIWVVAMLGSFRWVAERLSIEGNLQSFNTSCTFPNRNLL